MKLEITIDENKILELANTTSIDELPRNIYYEAKRQAIEVAVKEIKEKLVETPYYGGKESLYSEVRDYLAKQIEGVVKKYIEDKFSEKSIESLVSRLTESKLNNWLEKKVNERLETIKADLQFYSTAELQAEEDAREAEYNNQ